MLYLNQIVRFWNRKRSNGFGFKKKIITNLYFCAELISFCSGFYSQKHYAKSLKTAQNSKWAYKHVHMGIKHFKASNKVEAFQCLNQALNIDPDNVEGLVARGRYHNRGADWEFKALT